MRRRPQRSTSCSPHWVRYSISKRSFIGQNTFGEGFNLTKLNILLPKRSAPPENFCRRSEPPTNQHDGPCGALPGRKKHRPTLPHSGKKRIFAADWFPKRPFRPCGLKGNRVQVPNSPAAVNLRQSFRTSHATDPARGREGLGRRRKSEDLPTNFYRLTGPVERTVESTSECFTGFTVF